MKKSISKNCNLYYFIIQLTLLLSFCISAGAQSYDELNKKISQLTDSGNYKEALPFSIAAKDSAQKLFGDTSDKYASSICSLAIVYCKLGNYAAGYPLFKQTLSIVKNSMGVESADFAGMLNTIADNFCYMGYWDEAEPLYKQALATYKKVSGEKSQDYILVLTDLGGLYSQTAKYDSAEIALKEVIPLWKKTTGEDGNYASALINLGVVYFYKGNYTAAEPLYKQATAIYKNVSGDQSEDYATCLNNLGDLYNSMGYYVAAEAKHKEALAIRKKINGGNNPDYAQSLTQLGLVYFNMGNYSGAELLYKEALPIRKNLVGENSALYAYTLNNLAVLYYRKGDYSAAESLYKEVLNIRKNVYKENHPDYGWSVFNLATLYKQMGNYKEAEPLYIKAISIFKNSYGEENWVYARALSGLAEFYERTGNFQSAETLFKEEVAILKKSLGDKNDQYSMSLSDLGALYYNEGKYREAEPLYKESMTILKNSIGTDNSSYAYALSNLGNLYYKLGDYDAAEPLFKQGLIILKKTFGEENPEYAHLLSYLGVLDQRKHHFPESEKYLTESAAILLRHFHRNFLNLNESEKMSWWESEATQFELAPSLLAQNPSPSPDFLKNACTEQLQLKGFVLADGSDILQKARKSADPELKQIMDQWQSNKSTLSKQYSLPSSKRIVEVDSLEKVTRDLEKEINLKSSAIRNSQQNQQIGFDEVRKALKNDEAALEFIRFHSYHQNGKSSLLYAVFIILPRDNIPHFKVLCEEAQLAKLLESKSYSSEQFVKQLYRGIKFNNTQSTTIEKGDSLYELIWKPLVPWLRGIKRIDIAPAGLLNRIAFNALPAKANHLLIDRYQLRQYSSVRQIAQQLNHPSSLDSSVDIVLYGDIQFNETNSGADIKDTTPTMSLPDVVKRSMRNGYWDSLPGTLKEVNNIKSLFDKYNKKAQVLTGSEATEESFKMLSGHSPHVLHIATHGFMLPDPEQWRNNNSSKVENQLTLADDPLLRSGFIMAGANWVWRGEAPIAGKDDGIVTSYEIANMDLSNTELLVLSACETALGDLKGTEGVFGLQRAIKLAGVRNMILSLWQVPDVETAELMDRFYENQLKGMSIYKAFYDAQKEMRKKYTPYYWAAFVLME
jgi:CHAT domain-containing protein/Tfp pilus assembly protein PilF